MVPDKISNREVPDKSLTRSGLSFHNTETLGTQTTNDVCDTETQTVFAELQSIASAGTYSSKDKCKDNCIVGLQRLRHATPKGFHFTSEMILIVLRFVYHAVVNLNWSWNASCNEASAIFNIKRHTVHKMGMLHMEQNRNGMPPEIPQKKRGRGSDLFKQRDDDGRFMVLKERHLTEILSYVRERNRSMAGICTIRGIVTHLMYKFGKEFKYHTVRYALTVRLGLKYRSVIKKDWSVRHSE